MTLNFCVHVFALGTTGQQFYQVDVVQQGARLVQSLSFRLHHVDKTVEGLGVTVKHQHFFTHIHQLRKQIAKINLFEIQWDPISHATRGPQKSACISGVTVFAGFWQISACSFLLHWVLSSWF